MWGVLIFLGRASALTTVLGALAPSLAVAQAESPTTYQPSPWRIEGGPILFLSPPGNDLWGFGGTVSVHYAVGARRLFFFGGRLAFLGGAEGNYGGSGGIADVDVGLRPRLATWHTGAFALVFAGGIGGAFIESPAASGPFPSALSFGDACRPELRHRRVHPRRARRASLACRSIRWCGRAVRRVHPRLGCEVLRGGDRQRFAATNSHNFGWRRRNALHTDSTTTSSTLRV